eukprot:5534792-Prymnesium_polylepis.1
MCRGGTARDQVKEMKQAFAPRCGFSRCHAHLKHMRNTAVAAVPYLNTVLLPHSGVRVRRDRWSRRGIAFCSTDFRGPRRKVGQC